MLVNRWGLERLIPDRTDLHRYSAVSFSRPQHICKSPEELLTIILTRRDRMTVKNPPKPQQVVADNIYGHIYLCKSSGEPWRIHFLLS